MSELLHVAPGADCVIIFMSIVGGFALYIGITLILDDFGRDVHELIKAYKAERANRKEQP